MAAWTGYPVVVERLLQAGADPNVRSRAGQTPLDTSVTHIWEGEQYAVARLLLEYGANPGFFAACVVGSSEHVKRYLADDPALVNRPFDQGSTPLEVAAEAGHVEVGALLVQAGAEVDIFSAASLGRQAQVEAFLRAAPALLDAKRPMGGYRPLHCAAECGHPEIVAAPHPARRGGECTQRLGVYATASRRAGRPRLPTDSRPLGHQQCPPPARGRRQRPGRLQPQRAGHSYRRSCETGSSARHRRGALPTRRQLRLGVPPSLKDRACESPR